MKVNWLIDGSVFDKYCEKLEFEVRRFGGNVVMLNRPNPPYGWDDVGNSYRDTFPLGSCVVTHADIDLVVRVYEEKIWTPGAFATVEKFYCSRYYAHLGKYLLNSEYVMLPFKELCRRQEFLFDKFGVNQKLFVRPDSPLKLFTGLVISKDSFEKDYEFMAFYEFPSESLVVVSSPKSIIKEWRFVVADRKVVTGSLYKEDGEFVEEVFFDQNAAAFAQRVVNAGFVPDPVWVIDVCQTTDDRYWLLEIGGFSFSFLYGCDMKQVVEPVSKAALKVAGN